MDLDILSPEFLKMAHKASVIAGLRESKIQEAEAKMDEVKKFMMKNKAEVAELDHQASELQQAYLAAIQGTAEQSDE